MKKMWSKYAKKVSYLKWKKYINNVKKILKKI